MTYNISETSSKDPHPHPHHIQSNHPTSPSHPVKPSHIPPHLPPINHLLKHLPISPLILLPPHLNRAIPTPHALHKLLILARIQLGEGIALVIGRDVEGGLGLLAADDEGALHDGVVGFTVHGRAAEDVFAGGFETGEEAACAIREIREVLDLDIWDVVGCMGRGGQVEGDMVETYR